MIVKDNLRTAALARPGDVRSIASPVRRANRALEARRDELNSILS